MIASRTLASRAIAFACTAAACPGCVRREQELAQFGRIVRSRAAMSDPMGPVNPYNAGSATVTMPGDARMGVFPYSRDQIFRMLTAPLNRTTIEREPGEKLITDPAMGDSMQWEIDDDKMSKCSSSRTRLTSSTPGT